EAFELTRVDGLDDRSLDLVPADRRDLRYDQGATARRFLQAYLCTYNNTSLASFQVVSYTINAHDAPALREIWSLDVGHELFYGHIGAVKQGDTGAYHFNQIVGWDAGGQADGNTTGSIDHRRDTARQIIGLDHFGILFIGRVQRYCITFHVGHERLSQWGEAHFRVAIGGRSITVLAAHVSLSFYQWAAHTKWL